MTVKDLARRISNGSAHITLIDDTTGEVILSTIWYQSIPAEDLAREVIHITVKDYELYLFVI